MLITNPTVNSYKRSQRRSPGTAIRDLGQSQSGLTHPGAQAGWRVTTPKSNLRSPDAMANPYLAFAVALAAGIDGIQRQIEPTDPFDESFVTYDDDEFPSPQCAPDCHRPWARQSPPSPTILLLSQAIGGYICGSGGLGQIRESGRTIGPRRPVGTPALSRRLTDDHPARHHCEVLPVDRSKRPLSMPPARSRSDLGHPASSKPAGLWPSQRRRTGPAATRRPDDVDDRLTLDGALRQLAGFGVSAVAFAGPSRADDRTLAEDRDVALMAAWQDHRPRRDRAPVPRRSSPTVVGTTTSRS